MGHCGDVGPFIDQVVESIQDRDWVRLKPLLHPYLHWTDPAESTIRGRTNVLAALAVRPPVGPPLLCDLREGQVYRWREPPDDH